MSTITKIFRNLGQIVILLYQIVHEQVKWYIHSWKGVKRVSPKQEVKKIYEDAGDGHMLEIDKLKKNKIIERYRKEERESLERSHRMVDLCELPHYSTTNTKYKPE